MERTFMDVFGIWIAAFLTLGIISFLYKDNVLYKICESIFVGVSAGYWFTLYFWDNMWSKGILGIFEKQQYILIGGFILGVLLLMRLSSKAGWIARWSIAFIVGATVGLRMMGFLTTDALAQVHATVNELQSAFVMNSSYEIVGAIVTALATITGLIYFYFSKEHRGWFGGAAKVGTWFLMITFGASFGYTVMSRMSLLIGRVDFLLADWLQLIK